MQGNYAMLLHPSGGSLLEGNGRKLLGYNGCSHVVRLLG